MIESRVRYFDVFNGDADGLCALHQLRLAEPRDARLFTGVKRDIELLRQVPLVRGARVTVLDVSLARNRGALMRLLECGMEIAYFDHHFAGDMAQHPGLQAHITRDAEVCTSMLVDRHLGGRHRVWAVVGAFGDNMGAAARTLAASLEVSGPALEALRELGECLNYNAYGDSLDDLFIAPDALYRRLRHYSDPWQFMREEPVLAMIQQGRVEDLERAGCIRPYATCDGGRVFLLPDAAWSRRVRGTWANQLAQASPGLAHALLASDGCGAYVVSVRAPTHHPHGAERLCLAFPGGGGRAAAAGIDRLEHSRLPDFVSAFEHAFRTGGPE